MLGFLIAAAAGFFVPQIEGPVAGPIIKALDGTINITPDEKRLVAFMAALLGAGIISVLLESGSILGVIFGVILGYFGTRIYAKLKQVIDGRSGPE